MPAGARPRTAASTPLGRIAANTAWLLGGKGFGALCGLVYLAILTRTLGLKGFGHFSLIFGTAQALNGIAGFQSWRVVVRYGAAHVHAGAHASLGRLVALCAMVEASGAALGCAIAYGAIYGLGDVLGINPHYRDPAFYFSCAMLWALVSTPTGLLRVLDRFDMAVYVESVVPIGRLLAALVIWLGEPTLVKFLIAWAAIDLVEALCYWWMARRLCPDAVRLSHFADWRGALASNRGIGRFFLITYATSTVSAVGSNGPLLAVGALVGTRAAGLYRLANQITQSLSKLSTLLTRTVYAEFNRARVVTAAAEFRRLAARTSLIAAMAGAAVVGIALIFGDELLEIVGGEAFAKGHALVIPLAVAASLDLASVAFEPVLHASGNARHALAARIAGVVTMAMALALLVGDYHAAGIAWAVAAGAAVSYAAMGLMARRTLLRMHPDEQATAEAATDLPEPDRDD
jgi:O-antigen/teichoic acid export membrane protein